jgi:hypothetical protein
VGQRETFYQVVTPREAVRMPESVAEAQKKN